MQFAFDGGQQRSVDRRLGGRSQQQAELCVWFAAEGYPARVGQAGSQLAQPLAHGQCRVGGQPGRADQSPR
ncbi:MAG: hypothetical protein AW07_02395 [Candidatus Accumulibacter sp. SK-11]|nr:MAG: hypothetical protein AW07_02395 [Candidatus Accumulibacter sp. SK-11]